jgi:predicted DNA-binding transcriptional regulator AlpA
MENLDPGVTNRRSLTRRSRKLSPTRKVAERYSTSTRTIERWEIDPTLNFPKPIKIKRRKYWYENELDEFDAAQG